MFSIQAFYFSQSDAFVVYKKFYTYTEGFPGRDVLCGAEDKYGFLWFGTRNGLCRYDGYNFLLFTQKSHNLRGTKIIDLVADDSLGLIITYSESGSSFFAGDKRDVINVKTYEVKPLQTYYGLLPFKEEEVTSIKPGNNKELIFLTNKDNDKWVYTGAGGFEQIIGRRRSFKKICLHDTLLGTTPAERKNYNNYAIYLFADSTIRIPLYMPTAPPFYYELVSKSKRGYIVYYHDFLKNKKNYYFINHGGKAFHADSLGNVEAEFNKHEARTHCVSRNDESSIIHDFNGSILLYRPGVDFTKLFQNSETERVKRIRVKSFFKDSHDSYWLCTNEGVLQVKIKKKLFKTLFTNKENLNVSDNSTRGIYAEKSFTLCNTTDFSVLRTLTDTTYYKYPYNFSVFKLDNELWIGSFELRKIDLTTKKVYSLIKSRKDEIWSIFSLNKYELLLGCTGGLDIYNRITNTIDSVDYMGFPKAKFIYRIFRNSQGQIMAVADNGLYILSPEGIVIDCYSAESPDKAKQLPCVALHDVYEDKEGNYWIASNIDGFFKWNRKNNSFTQFGKEHGFISTIICCIQEDNMNRL